MITTVCKISYGSQTVPPIVPAVQGDTGRAISFEIADFTPPAGATATYFILKPSGEAIYNSATITDNSILCELTAQSLAEAGENRMQVRVLHGEDIVTSFEVILMVRTFLGDDAMESGTEMNIFDQAVEQATEQFQTNAEQIVEEVIESIPADYTELTEEVGQLNERIGNVSDEVNEIDEAVTQLASYPIAVSDYPINTTCNISGGKYDSSVPIKASIPIYFRPIYISNSNVTSLKIFGKKTTDGGNGSSNFDELAVVQFGQSVVITPTRDYVSYRIAVEPWNNTLSAKAVFCYSVYNYNNLTGYIDTLFDYIEAYKFSGRVKSYTIPLKSGVPIHFNPISTTFPNATSLKLFGKKTADGGSGSSNFDELAVIPIGQTAIIIPTRDYVGYNVAVEPYPSAGTLGSVQYELSQPSGAELLRKIKTLSSKAERPLIGYENFSVSVNYSDYTNNGNDGSTPFTDYGVVALPSSYSPSGNSTPLIIFCQGTEERINSDTNPLSYYGWEYFLAKGYAVMDMNGISTGWSANQNFPITNQHYCNKFLLSSYAKGYKYVTEKYNISKRVYVAGISMGGGAASLLVQSGILPVIANVLFCPALSVYKQDYLKPWSGTNQQKTIAGQWGFPNWSTTTPSQEYFLQNIDKIKGFDNLLIKSVGDHQTANANYGNEAEAAAYNAMSKVHPVPLKIWHCQDDTTVLYRYSEFMINMIKNAGGQAWLHAFATGGHTGGWNTGSVTDAGVTTSIPFYEAVLFMERFN